MECAAAVADLDFLTQHQLSGAGVGSAARAGERMSHLSRRDLLKQSAGATMVVRASPAWAMSPSHSPTPEGARRQAARPKGVVIAGGGLSGLCCGHELTIRGPEVVVPEATNRTGGHVKALHRPLSDGLYADAGAEHFAQHGFTLGNGSSMPFGSAGG